MKLPPLLRDFQAEGESPAFGLFHGAAFSTAVLPTNSAKEPFFLVLALVSAIAGWGMWSMREWGRILSIILAVISLIFSLPGLLMMGLHLHLFFGTYRLFRIAISILIIWYLVQPQIKVLFQRGAPPALPLAR